MKYAVALALGWYVGAVLWAVSADGWLDVFMTTLYLAVAIGYCYEARRLSRRGNGS